MAQKLPWTPWREAVRLRDDLKTGELSLSVFAADLYDVVMRKGRRPVYEDPAAFFALTYPTLNLRELVRDVALRLAGRSDKAYRKLSVNYGGGKTHTLIALRHLAHDPAGLPDSAAVREFEAHIGFAPPKARVAALCFDKIDLEKGVETLAPDGAARTLKHPWSVLAFQLAGAEGLRAIHAEGDDKERDTPPAEPLLTELLAKPQEDGLATLVLLDEVLMYVRGKVEADPAWRGRLTSFLQHLTQAVVKVDRCAMVASLLASDPRRNDDFGGEILAELSNVFGRQMEEDASPVGKEDVAEVLRRRFFEPDSIRDAAAFRPHVAKAVGNVAALDEEVKKQRGAAEERYLASFPFHPDLTEVFYSRWTQLDGFQRARGILRTFAIALRDAEKWDTGPLVSANVFLNAPGEDGLSEAARELSLVASVDGGDGGSHQWVPIVEGELAKARAIQSEAAGLRHREVEQAVVAVFLNSQPIGRKALTRELLVLLGASGPDRIELEKALRRWTELSWFLDEAEAETGETGPDGARQLPRAWRLGNRPNLRQMHFDACRNRAPSALVEARLIDAVEKLKPLTQGAAAAGARVHNLPEKPNDVQDDGAFHYAVLGPKAASESGKPSAEAKRFIDETTAPDRPRVHRNAVVLAVPSRDGLDAARARVREHLGWLEVRGQLKGQSVDPIREQMLAAETDAARRRIPEALRQAWSIVVTVNESNAVQAFKATVADEPLFTAIKADRRARIQETAVSAEALMPGGPYDLWREGEDSRRVKDLVGAFAQFPQLPKMLRRKEVLDTVVHGVREGTWVARTERPDRTVRTFWREAIDEEALADPGLEVARPEAATLTELAPDLLAHRRLPGLWPAEETAVADVVAYFAGGRTATVPKEGYEETIAIPKCDASAVGEAVSTAVERGVLWLINGPASICGEPVPAGVLAPAATLRSPPEPVGLDELTAESLPDAWKDGKANALAISAALSNKVGKHLPWPVVRQALESGLRTRWLELAEDDAPWPCEFAEARNVTFRTPGKDDRGDGGGEDDAPKPKGALTAETTLRADGIQDLADQIPGLLEAAVGHALEFHVQVRFGGETPPDPDAVDRVNALLAEASEELKLK